MYGKAMTHLVRLTGIIATLNKTINLIANAPDVGSESITENYIKFCDDNLVKENSYLPEFSMIDSQTVVQAETLLRYYIK